MLLISVELFLMLCILLFIRATTPDPASSASDRRIAGRGRARIAGGIFTKIADIGSD